MPPAHVDKPRLYLRRPSSSRNHPPRLFLRPRQPAVRVVEVLTAEVVPVVVVIRGAVAAIQRRFHRPAFHQHCHPHRLPTRPTQRIGHVIPNYRVHRPEKSGWQPIFLTFPDKMGAHSAPAPGNLAGKPLKTDPFPDQPARILRGESVWARSSSY